MEVRLISRPKAAAYCGLTPRQFDVWVNEGRLPGALPNTRRWDLRAIDLALDRLSGIASPTPPVVSKLAAWQAKDGATKKAGALHGP